MIALTGLRKVYGHGATRVEALAGVDLRIDQGEMAAIMGPSGSGKSTLMNLLGCLDRPTAGAYLLAGRSVGSLGDDEQTAVRSRQIGFVFQSYNLLSRLTALQNVEAPLIYHGLPGRERRRRALAALGRVGLAERTHHLPNQLSGGQQQRVAIARALVIEPAVLLGDEPTGNLDTRTGAEVLALFQDLNRAGMTLVLVTHDEHVAAHCRRVIRLQDGLICADTAVPAPLDARDTLAGEAVR